MITFIKFIFSIPNWVRIVFSLFYLALIAIISLIPANDIPEFKPFPSFDKAIHAIMYFGLTILACWTFHSETRRILIVAIVLFSLIWGMLMEISEFQMMVGRSFDLMDELFNAIGTAFGAAFYMFIATWYKDRQMDKMIEKVL